MDLKDLKGLASTLPKTNSIDSFNIPEVAPIDRRSRAEKREDFEKKLAEIDKAFILRQIEHLSSVSNLDASELKVQLQADQEELVNTLIKFSEYIIQFEELNSEENRKLSLKELELRLEAKNDWKDKFRVFFFRVLGSALLIATLFVIGYIEHEYDWAHLPMSKYIKVTPQAP